MSFEDDMIEDGFNNEEAYIEHLMDSFINNEPTEYGFDDDDSAYIEEEIEKKEKRKKRKEHEIRIEEQFNSLISSNLIEQELWDGELHCYPLMRSDYEQKERWIDERANDKRMLLLYNSHKKEVEDYLEHCIVRDSITSLFFNDKFYEFALAVSEVEEIKVPTLTLKECDYLFCVTGSGLNLFYDKERFNTSAANYILPEDYHRPEQLFNTINAFVNWAEDLYLNNPTFEGLLQPFYHQTALTAAIKEIFLKEKNYFHINHCWRGSDSDKWKHENEELWCLCFPEILNRERRYALHELGYHEPREFHSGLAAFLYNDKYGFIDSEGNVVIQPQYEYVYDFEGNYAIVEKDGHKMIIDKEGTICYRINTKGGWISNFHNGYAFIYELETKEVSLFSDMGHIVYKSVNESINTFGRHIAGKRKKSKSPWVSPEFDLLVLNEELEFVSHPDFTGLNYAESFLDGKFYILHRGGDVDSECYHNGEWLIIDKEANPVFDWIKDGEGYVVKDIIIEQLTTTIESIVQSYKN